MTLCHVLTAVILVDCHIQIVARFVLRSLVSAGYPGGMTPATDTRVGRRPWCAPLHLLFTFALSVSAAYVAVLVSMAVFSYVQGHLATVDSRLVVLLLLALVWLVFAPLGYWQVLKRARLRGNIPSIFASMAGLWLGLYLSPISCLFVSGCRTNFSALAALWVWAPLWVPAVLAFFKPHSERPRTGESAKAPETPNSAK